MKRQLLTAVAIMVSAFFVGTMIAQAASVEIGGQLRPRFEYNEQSNFNNLDIGGDGIRQPDGDYFVSTRIRLHAKADILPDTSAFIQLQSVRNFGNDLEGITSGANVPGDCAGPGLGCTSGGSGNAAFSPSDNDNTVGVHQAYFTLKNFATLPVDLQVGRQEVVLDGHRILGNTGWTQGAQTHDAARLTHHSGNLTLAYVYSIANEGGRPSAAASASANDTTDVEVHVIYANLQGILGGGLSLYFVGLDDGCSNGGGAAGSGCRSTAGSPLDNNIYTIGARQAGQLYGIDYRVEFYYQFGDAEGDALNVNGAAGGAAPYTTGADGRRHNVDRSAYMLGARVGKKFTNVMWKPGITLWYDYLSGTSDSDARSGDFKTFNTLFDTGHKFYGFQDLFLPANGAATRFLGLVDYAIKGTLQPRKNWVVKADYHWFTTAEGIEGNTRISGSSIAGPEDDDTLGNELDLTLVHKYNANTTISAGYSKFWQQSSFELIRANASSTGNPSPADWAYVMFDVKF